MPGPETQPLFDAVKAAGMAMTFGYAELTPKGEHFNTSIFVDKAGEIVAKYRKVHLPGDLGFPVYRTLDGIFGMCICADQRLIGLWGSRAWR